MVTRTGRAGQPVETGGVAAGAFAEVATGLVVAVMVTASRARVHVDRMAWFLVCLGEWRGARRRVLSPARNVIQRDSGTVMRYAQGPTNSVTTLAPRVAGTAGSRPLVAAARSANALCAGRRGARASAVALASVATPADLHDPVAARAVVPAVALVLGSLDHVLATRGWT